MNRIIIIFIFIAFGFSGCTQSSLRDRRKATMNLIVNCLKKNDTAQLYKLIDTSYNGEVKKFDIAFLHRQLAKTNFKIEAYQFRSVRDGNDYTYQFDANSKNIKSITIEFSFSPGISNRVFSLSKSLENWIEEPLKAPGVH